MRWSHYTEIEKIIFKNHLKPSKLLGFSSYFAISVTVTVNLNNIAEQ